MGLSGRKNKQRIGADPRNLTWSDDAAKFGTTYLSKFGWDPSQGLGLQGDGRTSHIKVAQKLDLMGIGGGKQGGPEAVAWKQSRDYEILLKRLNESIVDVAPAASEASEEAVEDAMDAVVEAGHKKKRKKDKSAEEDNSAKKTKRKKSSHNSDDADPSSSKSEKKKTKQKKSREEGTVATTSEESAGFTATTVVTETIVTPSPIHVPRPMAHRARFLASKRLSAMSSNAAAMSEILGVAPSTPGSSSATPNPPGTPSVLTTASSQAGQITLEQLSTSTKSVADYFKEKLAARAGGSKSPVADVRTREPAERAEEEPREAPRLGLGARGPISSSLVSSKPNDDEDEAPRMGLGAARAATAFPFFAAASKASVDDDDEKDEGKDDGVGLGDKNKKTKKSKNKRHDGYAPVEAEATEVDPADVVKKSKKRRSTKDDDDVPDPTDASGEKQARKLEKERKRERKEKKKRRREEKVVDGEESI